MYAKVEINQEKFILKSSMKNGWWRYDVKKKNIYIFFNVNNQQIENCDKESDCATIGIGY
jgi:hypothetical protein